jgi:type II secretory pathway component GspD/PulD (secretin)
VEVTKNDKFEYDLNLVQAFPDLTARGLIMDMNEVIPKLTSSRRDRFVEYKSAGGYGTGFYADRHVTALLTAMQAKDYGRILAKPKILVNDNEKGTIGTTDTTYVTKTSSIPVTSGAGGQQNTLIQTAVDYEGYDAGITLDITPHISEGQLLRLEIMLTRKDFGTITGTKPPDTTSSDLNTVVTVPDGSTIILGGMVKMNQGKGGTKVPLLGDLPLVGALFRSVSNTDLQRRLYIFVKAEIIRPAETLAQGLPDLERISQRNRLAFETYEQEFQRYKSVPGVKSKPVAPAKVLDTE